MHHKRMSTNLHARWRQGREFLLHTIGDAREHGGAARKDNISIQITPDIQIAFEDGVVSGPW